MWRLVDTATVAGMLGVTPEWVREHASELGAVRLSKGPRAPLRFDPDQVRERVMERRVGVQVQESTRRRPGPRRKPDGVEMLPLPQEGP